MRDQRSAPGCGCAVLAAVVIGSFLVAIYGGGIDFPFVLFVASGAFVGYIIYRAVRQP